MSQTMLTAVTGLMAHQRKLDIVANNLANVNTAGFKAQRILFGDLLYTNLKPAGTSNSNVVGGTNPQQIGLGVAVSQINRNFNQGIMASTGAMFDFAIEGQGFFVVNNGEPLYTRTGAFALDSRNFLVDPATGAYVQRWGTVGEGNDGNPAFQVEGNSAIRVPLGSAIPGRKSAEAAFNGNLPAAATPPAAELLTSFRPYTSGGSPATSATLLNDLDSNLQDYTAGDILRLSGFDFYGNPIDATLNVDETTTLGDIVDFYNSALVDATAWLTPEGHIKIQATNTGPSRHRLELTDDAANVGATRFSDHVFVVQVKGKDADEFSTTMQIYDSLGREHSLNVKFLKMEPNTWDAVITLIGTHGTMTDGAVRRIEFSETGLFLGVNGVGDGDADIEIQFDSLTEPQRITLNFDEMTHLARSFTSIIEQDGYPPGNLVSVAVTAEGILQGIATNGRNIPLAQLAIASFVNPLGLEAIGQNYFRQTANSGQPQVGPGLTGTAGIVRGGQLETSNVDIAMEFTQLIVAQRGFSANARTITVASEVMQELVNLLR